MAFLGSVKDFFLPSSDVARERRRDVFGTESKAVAGAVIVGAAAAAIAAPAVLAGGGLRSVGAKIAALSVPKQAALALAVPALAGVVVSEPKTVTRTAGGVLNLQKNIYEAAKEPSVENFKDIFQENPVIATVAAGAIAAGSAGLIATLANTAAVRENTRESADTVIQTITAPPSASPQYSQPPPNAGSAAGASMVPITPETQVLGKSAGTGAVARRKKTAKKSSAGNTTVRLNIVNQQTYIGNSQRESYGRFVGRS